MRRILTTAILLGVVTSAAASPPPVAVTACGQAVPRRTVGYLTGDLDCTGPQSGAAALAAVFVAKRGTLELHGYTIHGSLFGIACGEPATDSTGQTVLTNVDTCTINGGGGGVTDAEIDGITAKKLTARDLTIRNSGEEGAFALFKGVLNNVTITDNGGFGARLDYIAKITNSTITGNGEYGIDTGRLWLTGSTVTGNGIGPNCGPSPLLHCADLHVYRRPKLIQSTCGTSVMTTQATISWGVCQLD